MSFLFQAPIRTKSSSMLFHNFLSNGKAYACTFKFCFAVQLLENDKHFLCILLIDAYAIIFHGKKPVLFVFDSSYFYYRKHSFFSEFDGVADKVLNSWSIWAGSASNMGISSNWIIAPLSFTLAVRFFKASLTVLRYPLFLLSVPSYASN